MLELRLAAMACIARRARCALPTRPELTSTRTPASAFVPPARPKRCHTGLIAAHRFVHPLPLLSIPHWVGDRRPWPCANAPVARTSSSAPQRPPRLVLCSVADAPDLLPCNRQCF
ncbi:MAG: hypothetical protein J3K34DRAFT_433911, partial [Monoraphidium minutum]